MKYSFRCRIGFSILLICVLVSCKKYVLDNETSFKSAKGRLCNEWTLDSVTINENTLVIIQNPIANSEFDRDGNFRHIYSDGSISAGTWEFSNKKEKILLMQFGAEKSMQILKLTKSEFVWKELSNSPSSVSWTYAYSRD